MRYRLRTLLIVATVGPLVLAAMWWFLCTPANYVWGQYRLRQEMIEEFDQREKGFPSK